MDRRTLLAAGGAVIVAGAGAAYFLQGDDAPAVANASARRIGEANDFGIADMTLGSPDAPVEVIEYASFTCPHCASFHASQFPQLKANYIDTGKIHFGYREVYFDRFGLWASMVARCGGEMRFFGLASAIYEKQREWTASGDPAIIMQELRKIAKTAGLDDAMLDECMSDEAKAKSLADWYAANAERDGINSTPTFLINGEKYGNMPYDEFAALIDARIAS